MAGLLDGLGLKNLEGMDLFEDQKKAAEPEKAKAPVMQESDFLVLLMVFFLCLLNILAGRVHI